MAKNKTREEPSQVNDSGKSRKPRLMNKQMKVASASVDQPGPSSLQTMTTRSTVDNGSFEQLSV